jgi:hypothetical protein
MSPVFEQRAKTGEFEMIANTLVWYAEDPAACVLVGVETLEDALLISATSTNSSIDSSDVGLQSGCQSGDLSLAPQESDPGQPINVAAPRGLLSSFA